MTSTLRFGILGAARITPTALINAVQDIPTIELYAVAARDRDRAENFAQQHRIDSVFQDYQAVIDSPDVDVVYNPLPINLHAPWTIAALRAGKHVLCEKPFALNADEAQSMVDAAAETGMILGEAFHYRYHPMMDRIMGLIRAGVIGSVQHVDARFNISIAKPNIRWEFATGGGSLMDLGCYSVHWVRTVTGEEPNVTQAAAQAEADAVDASMVADLVFPSGATGHIESSMVTEDEVIELTITGSGGRITAINPLAPQNGNQLTIETERGSTTGQVEAGSTYTHMMRAFTDHVLTGAPFVTQGADAVNNMAAIDRIYQAAGLPLRGH